MSGPVYKNGGTYWGKVISNHLGKTKNNKPQFILQFQIIGEVDPTNPDGDLLSCPVGERTVFRVFTPDTVEWMKDELAALGFTGDRPSLLEMTHPEGFDFGGKELPFYCKHETWEGKTREKWGISTGKSQLEITPLEPKDLRELDNLFGRNLKTAKPVRRESKPTEFQKSKAKLMDEAGEKFDQDINAQLAEASADDKDLQTF